MTERWPSGFREAVKSGVAKGAAILIIAAAGTGTILGVGFDHALNSTPSKDTGIAGPATAGSKASIGEKTPTLTTQALHVSEGQPVFGTSSTNERTRTLTTQQAP